MTVETAPLTGTWNFDPAHTVIGFTTRHMGVMKVRGDFPTATGSITIGETAEESRVEVDIDAASINTGVNDRDTHLRSPDFLDVPNYPLLKFRSTSVKDTGDGLEIVGDLTIKDVTNPVTLQAQFAGTNKDPWGNTKAFFAAETSIIREDWGLNWNVALETGGWLVSKEVKIEIELEAVQA